MPQWLFIKMQKKKKCKKKNAKKKSKMRQCTLITEDNRSAVFEKFWKEMTWNEKKMYVVSLVEKNSSGPKNNRWSESKIILV